MRDLIRDSDFPVTLVGGGAATAADLTLARGYAPDVFAVDGGAVLAVRAGVPLRAVIGDFDSLPDDIRAGLDPQSLWHITEQDDTDFEKALRRVRAPLIIGVGFTGGRLDHQLAALSALLRFHEQPCVLLSETEIIFHCPPKLRLDLPEGAVVSLYPLAPVTGRSTGLQWPIDGLSLSPGGRIGTSNRALGGRAEISVDAPGLLVLLPRAMLGAVTRALVPSLPPVARQPVP